MRSDLLAGFKMEVVDYAVRYTTNMYDPAYVIKANDAIYDTYRIAVRDKGFAPFKPFNQEGEKVMAYVAVKTGYPQELVEQYLRGLYHNHRIGKVDISVYNPASKKFIKQEADTWWNRTKEGYTKYLKTTAGLGVVVGLGALLYFLNKQE